MSFVSPSSGREAMKTAFRQINRLSDAQAQELCNLFQNVVVAPDFRGHQLGRALLDAVVSHPALARVGHIELYCLPELVPFYQKWGFTGELGALRFMRRTAPAR